MIQEVIGRRFSWALALAAAVAALTVLAYAGLAHAAEGFTVTANQADDAETTPGVVKLQWEEGIADDEATASESHRVRYSTSAAGLAAEPSYLSTQTATDNIHYVGGLTSGVTYYFQVEVYDGTQAEQGDLIETSTMVSYTVQPLALTGVEATNTGEATGEVKVSFDDPEPQDPAISGYQFQLDSAGSWYEAGETTVEDNMRSFLVKALPTEATTVSVRAVTSNGTNSLVGTDNSDDVTPAEVTPTAIAAGTCILGAEGTVESTMGDGRVTFEWPALPGDQENYRVEYRLPPDDWKTWTIYSHSSADAAATVAVTGLTNDKTYFFRIGCGKGTSTQWTPTTRTGATVYSTSQTPSALSNSLEIATLTAEVNSDTQVTLTWTKTPIDALTYEVEYLYRTDNWGTGGISPAALGPTSDTATVSGLNKDNGTHRFRVRATRGTGDDLVNGPWREVSATPGQAALNVPATPAGVSAYGGQESVVLEWSDPGDRTIDRWEIQQQTADGLRWSNPKAGPTGARTTKYEVTGLVNDTSYTFRVRAHNGAGFGPWSAAVTATAGDIPAPPDNTAPETTIEAEIEGLMATFMLSSSEEGSTFECSLDGAPFSACTSPHVMTDLDTGRHVFQARAIDAAGNTDLSSATYVWMAVAPVNYGDCTHVGTEGDDILIGTDGDDVICGLGGNDVIRGGKGNDVIRGGAGDDILIGGAGNDTLRGGSGNDRLIGKAGNDMLFGEVGDDTLNGNAGDDMLRGGPGNDTLKGGSGDDMLYGGSGDDVLRGEAGDDMLVGGKGQDTLKGGSGNNTLRG